MSRFLAPLLVLTALLGAALCCESSPPAAQLAQGEGTGAPSETVPEPAAEPEARDPDTLPEQALRRLGTRAFAHEDPIRVVAWGGDRVVTSSEAELRVWEANSGALLSALATPVAHLALSRDGQVLATSPAHAPEVRLWRIGEARPRHTLQAGLRHVTALAFAPDGALLAAASSLGEVTLFGVAEGDARAELSIGGRWPSTVAFSAAGERVAVGSRDGSVWVFETTGGEAVLSLEGALDRVSAVAFGPAGQLLAVAGSDLGTVALYEAGSGALWANLEGHQGAVTDLAFTPAGDQLVSVGLDWTVRRWNVDAAVELSPRLTLGDAADTIRRVSLAARAEPLELPDLALAPDGAAVVVASGGHGLARLPLEASAPRWAPAGRVTALAFTEDGSQVLAGNEDGSVAVWEALGGELVAVLEAPGEAVTALAVEGARLRARSGWTERTWDLDTHTQLAVAGGRFTAPRALRFDTADRLVVGDYGRVVVLDPQTGLEERLLLTDPRSFVALATTPSGQLLGLGRAALGDELFDVLAGTHVRTLDVHDQRAVVLSGDGSTLATLARSGVVTVWLVGAATSLVRYEPRRRVERLALSPDGSWLAAGERGDLILWEVGGAALRQPTYAGHVSALAWSSDGNVLAAVGTHQLLVYDLTTGLTPVRVSQAYDAVALTSDGSTVAALDGSGQIALWRAGEVEPFRVFDTEASEGQGMTSAAPALAFSPDGQRLAALDRFNQLTVWDLESRSLLLRLGDGTIEPTAPALQATSADHRLTARLGSDGAIEIVEGAFMSPVVRQRFVTDTRVRSLAFSPDGRLLASGSDDTTVLLWPLDPVAAPTTAPTP